MVEVQVKERWQDTSLLVHAGDKSQRLIGMPIEDAETLAQALST